MTTVHTRRRFIRQLGIGATGGALLAPFAKLLDARKARAQPAETPKRFLVMFSPNGTIQSHWTASGADESFALSNILAPLAPLKERVLIPTGIDLTSARVLDHDGHAAGMGHVLTGSLLLPGTPACRDGCSPVSWPRGPSVDQVIAEHIGATTRLRSLHCCVDPRTAATVYRFISYRAASQPVPDIANPAQAYSHAFGDGRHDAALLARRRSLLDRQLDNLERLERRLPAADRERLNVHTEAVRDIERRVSAHAATCVAPELVATPDDPARGKMFADIMAMAFACDVTRVGTLQWYNSGRYQTMPWIGIPTLRHHDLAHDTSPGAINLLVRINTWFAQQFAYLVGRFSSIPTGVGDETLADHTVMLWVNELSDGVNHTHRNMPFALAGNIPRNSDGRPTFATGRRVDFGGRAHNDLLLTLLHAFGINAPTFGEANLCSGPMTQLLAA